MAHRTPFVGLAGIIGAGKSTLTRNLSAHLGWEAHMEPVETNPYLEDFYRDMHTWSFPMQVCLFTKRYQAHQQIQWSGRPAIQDRTIWEDTLFARMLARSGHIHPRDLETYRELFTTMTTTLQYPTHILYLDVSVETAMGRIASRGRKAEVAIPREYLEELRMEYEQFLVDIAPFTRVIRVPWEHIGETAEVARLVSGQPGPVTLGVETLTLVRNRVARYGDTYVLELPTARLLASKPRPASPAPSVFLGCDSREENPPELNREQKVALVEIVTGLRGPSLEAYEVQLLERGEEVDREVEGWWPGTP